jgi:hypothetical protein
VPSVRLSTREAVTSLTHILIKPCLSEYLVNGVGPQYIQNRIICTPPVLLLVLG